MMTLENSELEREIDFMNALCAVEKEYKERGGTKPNPLHWLSERKNHWAVTQIAEVLVHIELLDGQKLAVQ